jgi:hypothetical protein
LIFVEQLPKTTNIEDFVPESTIKFANPSQLVTLAIFDISDYSNFEFSFRHPRVLAS